MMFNIDQETISSYGLPKQISDLYTQAYTHRRDEMKERRNETHIIIYVPYLLMRVNVLCEVQAVGTFFGVITVFLEFNSRVHT
jgi:hypothetical protein